MGLGLSGVNIALIGGALFLFGGLGGWAYLLSSSLDSNKAEISKLQERKNQLARVQKQIRRSEQQREQLEERIGLIQRLKNNQKGPVRLMNGLLDAMPSNPKLWLTSMVQKGRRVVIEGHAFDVPAVADFISDLDRTPPFKNIELEFWEDQKTSIKFKLNCEIEG